MPGEPGLTLAADRPIVVAHRGASVEQPENTIEAFEAAIDAGADAVEFDVRLTADGLPVVMHDPDVARTTNGEGLVSSKTLEEIRRLRIELPGGGAAGVPTLEEALACLADRAAADIELKNGWDEPGYDPLGAPALQPTLDVLDRTAFAGAVLLSSFDEPTLIRARSLRPDVSTGLLLEARRDATSALEAAANGHHDWVLPFVGQVLDGGPGFPGEVHGAGLRLGVWIVDDEEMARTLFSWGADSVATNDPRAIVPIRDSREKRRILVAHDYGAGGIWASMLARSTDEIRSRFPSLAVVDERPVWLTDEELRKIEARMTIDIDDVDHPFLRAVSEDVDD